MTDYGSFQWPPSGGSGGGITIYANFAAFPASAPNGTVAKDAGAHILYEYNTSTSVWEPIASNTAYLDALASAGSATSIGALDSQSANANGLSLVGGVLSTQSASGSFPGLVNTTGQTFAGNKNFNGDIFAHNLGGTNSGDVTLAAIGSVPNANGASLSGQVLTLQPADGTNGGLVSNTAQHFLGQKYYDTYLQVGGTSITNATVSSGSNFSVVNSFITSVAYGGVPTVVGYKANGTEALPTAVLADQIMNAITARGYDGTAWVQATKARIAMMAGENWTNVPAANGTYMAFSTTANGTTSLSERMRIFNDGNISIGNTTSSAKLSVTGTIVASGTITGSNLSGTNTGDQTITLSGDVSGSGTGAITTAIGANKVTLAMQATLAANSAIANATGSTATPTAVPMVATATASAIAIRDANANTRANNFISNYATTATAAGTTTLVVGSARTQAFTGTTTQTVVLPDATTLVVGQSYTIINRSTGVVTVNANGGGLVQTMVAGSQTIVIVTSIGTSAGAWISEYTINGLVVGIQPTIQKFTSSSGTYTTPAGVQYVRVRMVGGGGGGAGGSSTGGAGGTGGNTTFGTSLLVANGGGGGGANSAPSSAGGTASLGTGPIGTAIQGGIGGTGGNQVSSTTPGGYGASSPFGGAGSGAQPGVAAGNAAIANSGSGGGGGGMSTGNPGGGGSAGGFVDALISTPLSTYAYAVGSAGAAGTAGTGAVGGAGGSGYIEVTEYYTNYAVGTTASVSANQVLAGPTSGGATSPTFRALVAADLPNPRSQESHVGVSGYGSTNTAMLRFTTNSVNLGSNITYAASTTLGDTWTINATGVYAVSMQMRVSTGGANFGLLRNGSGTQLTTSASSIGLSSTGDNGYVTLFSTIAAQTSGGAITVNLNSGDVIRIGSDTGLSFSTTSLSITQVSN